MNRAELLRITTLGLFLSMLHCKSHNFIDYIDSGTSSEHSNPVQPLDAGVHDAPSQSSTSKDSAAFKWDGFLVDYQRKDASSDVVTSIDAAKKDASQPLDKSSGKDNFGPKDAAWLQEAVKNFDQGAKLDAPKLNDLGSSVGPACQTGQGTAAYRFRYGNAGTNAQLEAWGLKSNEWWEVVPVYQASSLADNISLLLPDSSSYVRVRWSFTGITSFSKATLCIYARSYSTGASAKFRVWTPLHGENTSDLVSVYPYDWHCLDISTLIDPSDKPGLLGYRLYPDQYGSSSLAIHAVELCLQGIKYQ